MGKELGGVAKFIVWALEDVGKVAVEKDLEEQIKQAAEALAELTMVSREKVKTTIQDYKSKLEEQDRESFQKFMKIYEQKLEELRAEKKNSE